MFNTIHATDALMAETNLKTPVDVLIGVKKSTPIAYILWLFLGLFGGHRFYLGTVTTGLV